jgi:hydroxymethylpyrimidine/phosphomethylpyrimidine kinase
MSPLAPPIALTIAGSDPSGGAGLQADLKTFHQHGVYGASVVSLVTVQNTSGVTQVEPMTPALVRAQLDAVMSDLEVKAVKTGALGTAAIVEAVADALKHWRAPVVVDPVMVSKHGHRLLDAQAERALRQWLFPRATLITPNAPEAEALVGHPVASLTQAKEAAKRLAGLGATAVLLKGGHLDTPEAVDLLLVGGIFHEFVGPRVPTRATHGTGCTLSAAITAHLASGVELPTAVDRSKRWLERALISAAPIGRGIGPVNHFEPPLTSSSTGE